MTSLIWGIAILSIATTLHLLLWRIRLPKYQTRTLLLLYASVLLAALATTRIWAGIADPGSFLVLSSASEYLQTALFVIAFTLAYVITYSALEADSPTLVMIQAIARAGERGVLPEDLSRASSDDVLIWPRVSDLVRDGLVIQDQQHLRLTAKGLRFVRIFVVFRAILGAPKGG